MSAAPPMPRLPGYRLLERLGAGPRAQVYRALDESAGCEVAIKRFSPGRFSPATLAEYASLAAAAAEVPGAMACRVFGVAAEGPEPFAVMELLPGQSLAALLRQRPTMAWDHACGLFARVAGQLAAAHAAGLVHGGLHPGNIHVSRDAEGRVQVHLLDFGALALHRLDSNEATRAQDGPGVAYHAPEQLLGQPLDGRADLYSLGVMLFEALTGRLPFRGSATEVARKHLREPPPPLRELAPTLPPAAESLVQGLLEKQPARRPRSAEELRARLSFEAAQAAAPAPHEHEHEHEHEPETRLWVRPLGHDTEPGSSALRNETTVVTSGRPAPGNATLVLPATTPPHHAVGYEATLVPRGMDGDFLLAAPAETDVTTSRSPSATVFVAQAHLQKLHAPAPAPAPPPAPAWRRWLSGPWTLEKKLLALNLACGALILAGLVALLRS